MNDEQRKEVLEHIEKMQREATARAEDAMRRWVRAVFWFKVSVHGLIGTITGAMMRGSPWWMLTLTMVAGFLATKSALDLYEQKMLQRLKSPHA